LLDAIPSTSSERILTKPQLYYSVMRSTLSLRRLATQMQRQKRHFVAAQVKETKPQQLDIFQHERESFEIELLRSELAAKREELMILKHSRQPARQPARQPTRLLGSSPIEDAEGISHLAFSFMASKALFAALHIKLFTTLNENPMTMHQLAAAVPEGVTERKLTTLTTSLLSIGLLEKDGRTGLISNVPAADVFLVQGAKHEFGDYLRFQIDKQMYPFMDHLSSVIEGKQSAQRFVDYAEWFSDPEEAQLYSESQHSGSIGPARTLLKLADLSNSKQMLDVGGGSGAFSITLCQKHQQLHASVLDFPAVCDVGRRKVAEAGMEKQVSFIEGNCIETEWPKGQDIVLMSYLSSSVSGDELVGLYTRARECLNEGGMLIVHDFLVEDDRKGPPLAALWALQHAVFTPGAISITPGALSGMMQDAGFAEADIRIETMIPGMTKVAFGVV
jgi:hypothetical protein